VGNKLNQNPSLLVRVLGSIQNMPPVLGIRHGKGIEDKEKVNVFFGFF
jgi:hypothetical protein